MRRVLKATTEYGTKIKVTRTTCYTDDDVNRARAHARAMAPTGATVIFETGGK